MHAFAEFLFPDIDAGAKPPAAIANLVKEGHRGLPSGRGVYDWSKRDGQALVAERMEELFRHLKRKK
jgi:3-hydroxybutyryl-CoA dehydrogenase